MLKKQNIKNFIKYPLDLVKANFGYHRRYSPEPRLWILMYHRILPKSDPRYVLEEPGMIVEPDTFQMHLSVLKQEFTIVPLKDWVYRWQNGLTLPSKACAITFDDGWLDNYEYALSILESEEVPATLFAVSAMIGTEQSFWPNRIINLLQQNPQKLSQIDWLYKLIASRKVDEELTAQAIYSLKEYPDNKISKMIVDAECILGVQTPKERSLMSWEELNLMARSSFVDIGSHTCNHFRLRSDLELASMEYQIIESKRQLEQKLKKPIELFCYPNGDTCEASIKLVSSHYKAAVTTRVGINSKSSSLPHLLNRIPIHEHATDTPTKLLAKLSCWP